MALYCIVLVIPQFTRKEIALNGILWTSKNGKWIISRVTIWDLINQPMIVENTKTGFCDSPIGQHGKIVFDYPERIPEYVYVAVKRDFKQELKNSFLKRGKQ